MTAVPGTSKWKYQPSRKEPSVEGVIAVVDSKVEPARASAVRESSCLRDFSSSLAATAAA